MSNSNRQFVFEVVSHHGSPLSGKNWALKEGEGKIGRGEDCDLQLPDESRIVSRVHAIVRAQGNGCVWTDFGANPSVVDGRSLTPGEPCHLQGGERIQIGDYQLTLELVPGEDLFPPESSKADFHHSMSLPDDLDFLNVPQKSIDDVFFDLGDIERSTIEPECQPESVPDHPLSEPVFLSFPAKKHCPDVPEKTNAVASGQSPLELGLGLQAGQSLSAEQERLVGVLLRCCLDGVLQMLWSRKVFRNEMGASFTEILASKNNPLKFSMDVDEALERLLLKSHAAFMPPAEAINSAIDDLLQHNASALSGLQEALNTALHSLNPDAVQEDAARNGELGVIPLGLFRRARLWTLYCERYREIGRRPQDDPLNRLFSDSMRAAMQRPDSA